MNRLLTAFLRLRAFEVLGHREFRLLWLGHSFTSMAFWMDQVSRGWLIYELTDSALQLGLIRGVQAIPTLLLSPVAGSAADRYSRKMQILVAQIIDGLMLAALALLIMMDHVEPWHVYATAFGMAVVQTFQQPARAAMIADVLPRSHLTNAIGLNSIIFNVARSTGPAVAGILIGTFGTAGSFAMQALFYLLATVWTVQLRPAEGSSVTAGGHFAGGASFARSIIEGWKFSWNNETVRTALLVVMVASLFIVPFTTLLPVFARDILAVGATGQGLLLTAMGVGALGSAVIIAFFGDRLPRGIFMLGGVALYGVSVTAFSASSWFQLSLALMVVVGFANVCSHALVQTVIQTYSPSEFRGRTMSIFHMSNVVLTVGSMFIGALATLWGSRWAVALMGTAGALAMLAIHVMLPRARDIR
ncbi:MAG TPA: MFS transporter [Candidatus Binatia bacterium]|nr:MFS transporter [Candidatus Binatia bacterium]